MRATLFAFLTCLLVASCGMKVSPQADVTVTVAAGAFDRINTVVSVDLAEPPSSKSVLLIARDGRETSLQRGPDGRVWFTIDSLAANQTISYRLDDRSAADPLHAAAAAVSDGSVAMTSHGREVLAYHFEKTALPRADIDSIYQRGGYIHPVYTPSGILVTDDYPPNHVHHHGVWAAWTKTRYESRAPDFWNMGDGTGTVEPIALDTAWSGPVHTGFRARNRYVDLSGSRPETVLLETWETRLYPNPDAAFNIFDVHLQQVNVGDSTLVLPEYHYGGVGFRGHRQWNGAENAVFLTSEGLDRSNGHATTARWCHIGGKVDGSWAGVAILGHPENFRAPQPMRIHPDEPFFNFAPSQAGDWSIAPGDRYEARYRYVVYDGEPNVDLIGRLWNDYAHPPVVTVEYDR